MRRLRGLELLTLLLVTSCGDGRAALQLRFSPDTLLNSEEQILQVIDRLDLVLDASGGFSGVTGAGQVVGAFVAEDADQDGTLELRISRGLVSSSGLPLYRLRAGIDEQRSFEITARGSTGAEVAAVGGLPSAKFTPGTTLDLIVPFNLRPRYRAPRVLFTLPQEGQSSVPQGLAQVHLELSKEVVAEGASAHLVLEYLGSGAPQRVPGGWQLETVEVLELGLLERRSAASFVVDGDCSLGPGTYRISAGPGIRDAEGRALDQNAANDTADGYAGSFTISGKAQASPCQITPTGCASDKDCNPETETGPYVCNLADGTCIYRPTDCATLKCPPGHVCQPGAEAKCVQDCRLAGLCGGSSDYCDEASGLCLPCTPKATSPKCGTVSEWVKCTFESSTAAHSCTSARGGCQGLGSCAVEVTGLPGESLEWSSSCGGAATTTIDGNAEYVAFKCGTVVPVTEQVFCQFEGATTTQECYSTKGSCKGLASCAVKVSGPTGEKVEWKSSCGGFQSTLVDGSDEKAVFDCK